MRSLARPGIALIVVTIVLPASVAVGCGGDSDEETGMETTAPTGAVGGREEGNEGEGGERSREPSPSPPGGSATVPIPPAEVESDIRGTVEEFLTSARGAESVEIVKVESGDSGTLVTARPEGGQLDGSEVEVFVVLAEGEWKVDSVGKAAR